MNPFRIVRIDSPTGSISLEVPIGLFRRHWAIVHDGVILAEGRSWRDATPIVDALRSLIPTLSPTARIEAESLVFGVEGIFV